MSISGKLYKKVGITDGSSDNRTKWVLREFTFDPTNRYFGNKSIGDNSAVKWSIKVSDRYRARPPHTNDPEDSKNPFAFEVRGHKIVGNNVEPTLRK